MPLNRGGGGLGLQSLVWPSPARPPSGMPWGLHLVRLVQRLVNGDEELVHFSHCAVDRANLGYVVGAVPVWEL